MVFDIVRTLCYTNLSIKRGQSADYSLFMLSDWSFMLVEFILGKVLCVVCCWVEVSVLLGKGLGVVCCWVEICVLLGRVLCVVICWVEISVFMGERSVCCVLLGRDPFVVLITCGETSDIAWVCLCDQM
jgi:hypothetical protein